MRKTILLIGLALALLSPAPAPAATPGQSHLPDLVPLQAKNVRISRTRTTRLLRFSTVTTNQGTGPLELRPSNTSSQTTAYQRIYGHDAALVWNLVTETAVGSFEYHPSHRHWHFGQFATFDLRAAGPNGELTNTVVRSSGKVTFCILESMRLRTFPVEHPSPTAYRSCNQTSLQGLRAGYGDEYRYTTPGQNIDITGLPEGVYWLTQTIDPNNILIESNNSNNFTALRIFISARSSRVRYV